MPLNYTFVLPAILCLVAALAAPVLHEPRLDIEVPQPATARSTAHGPGAQRS